MEQLQLIAKLKLSCEYCSKQYLKQTALAKHIRDNHKKEVILSRSNARKIISKKIGNIHIISRILSYIYDTVNVVDLKRYLVKSMELAQYQTISEVYENIANVIRSLKSYVDICSKCCRINYIFFNKGQLLCPFCGYSMVNDCQFKFSVLSPYVINRLDNRMLKYETKKGKFYINIKNTNIDNNNFLDLSTLNGQLKIKYQHSIDYDRNHSFLFNFQKGKQEGRQIYYYNNTLPLEAEIHNMTQGVLNGLVITRYFDSFTRQIEQEDTQEYVNGVKQGKHTKRGPNNEQLLDEQYINDKLEGSSVSNDKFFDKYKKCNYSQDQLHGEYEQSQISQNIKIKTFYNQGKVSSDYYIYTIDDKPLSYKSIQNNSALIEKKKWINGENHYLHQHTLELGHHQAKYKTIYYETGKIKTKMFWQSYNKDRDCIFVYNPYDHAFKRKKKTNQLQTPDIIEEFNIEGKLVTTIKRPQSQWWLDNRHFTAVFE